MKKFSRYIEEMSMSVTLRPKKNNMYKVTGVGKKMAAHGGIKKGEKFHDSEIDGMHDSGIKVKYEKPKTMKKESSSWLDRTADTWNDHADHKDKKVQKHIKKAEKAYNDKDYDGFHRHTTMASDHAYKLRQQKKANESIQRRMDRMTIIATDPATGRKVVKVAPKKEIDIGKGKMESVVNEISDKMKINYINKAKKQVTDLEKAGVSASGKYDTAAGKENIKRRKGIRMATGKLGEDNVQELKTSTLASYQKKAGAQYKQAKVDSDERTAYKPFSVKGGRAADAAEKLKNKRGKGLAQSKKVLDKRYPDKQVKMAKGIAFDKRYKGGNMTGASKAINKIKPGLADHPKVANALRRANESKGE